MDHLFNTFMHSVAWHSGTMFVKMLGPVAVIFFVCYGIYKYKRDGKLF